MIVQEIDLVLENTPIFPVYGPMIRNNIENTAFDATIQTILNGNITYTVEVNLGRVDDNPENYINRCTFGQVVPDEDPDGDNEGWIALDPDFTNQTTGKLMMTPFPFNFMRLVATAGDPGAQVRLKYLQQGMAN